MTADPRTWADNDLRRFVARLLTLPDTFPLPADFDITTCYQCGRVMQDKNRRGASETCNCFVMYGEEGDGWTVVLDRTRCEGEIIDILKEHARRFTVKAPHE